MIIANEPIICQCCPYIETSQLRENADQENSEYRHFLRNVGNN